MQKVVVIVETKGAAIKKSALEVISVAAQVADKIQGQVEVVVFGSGVKSNLSLVEEFKVAKVHCIDAPELANYHLHTIAPTLLKLLQALQPHSILASASLMGKDLLPRLAAALGVGMASDCVAVRVDNGKLIVKRPIYAGKAFVELTFAGRMPFICTLRPNVFPINKTANNKPEVAAVAWNAADVINGGKLVEIKAGESKRLDLTEADIIVSGGRSMKNADNFKILFDLADVIGASVGASRAAVDAGYAPHSMQVGQTGKVVSPKLYMAFGISGAIQHLAGMRTSKVIVAVNTDPEAPIFKKADYGIVGDLFVLVPEIKKAFEKLLKI